MNTYMTEDEYNARYTTVDNHITGEWFYEVRGEEGDYIQSLDERYIWTYQDDDDGFPCITAGYRLVNRIGYVVTEEPWKDPNEFVAIFSESEKVAKRKEWAEMEEAN